jgi:hypothetical protein
MPFSGSLWLAIEAHNKAKLIKAEVKQYGCAAEGDVMLRGGSTGIPVLEQSYSLAYL